MKNIKKTIIIVVFLFLFVVMGGIVFSIDSIEAQTINVKNLPTATNAEEILKISYSRGSSNNVVTFKEADSINGPDCFYISGDDIYIGDSYNDSIIHYRNGSILNTIKLENVNFVKDFIVTEENIFVLDTYQGKIGDFCKLICLDTMGKFTDEIEIPNLSPYIDSDVTLYIPPSGLYIKKSNIGLKYDTGDNYTYVDNMWEQEETEHIFETDINGWKVKKGANVHISVTSGH